MRVNSKDEKGINVTFCSNCKTCPSVVLTKDSDVVILGGLEEGFSEWTKDQFREMVSSVKNGDYDEYI